MMKFMIASDLHGSAHYCRQLLDCFHREQAQRLILLGDLLYHGPRNDLPQRYDTREVAAMLNGERERLLCVRGNCDCEVDQMVLDFPMLADYAVLPQGEHLIYFSHGHIYNDKHPLPMAQGDVLVNGHFHVPCCRDLGSFVYMNPGSVSLPKENSWHGYMLLEDGLFLWKDLEGQERLRFQLPGAVGGPADNK